MSAGLRGKKIFLTGGTGFFGKSLLDLLCRGAHPETSWVILSRNPGKFLADNPWVSHLKQVRFLAGDVKNFTFPREHYDWIIHGATPAVTTLPEGAMRSVILQGTERVLSFAGHCGAEKLMFVSSGAVYGIPPPDVENIPEKFPCRPVTEYGIAKYEAEQMCRASGIFTLLPRCFAFVGKYLPLDIHYAAGNFLRDALAGREIVIRGDGTAFRSYLYADDLIDWLLAVLERGENGRPYHVGSPEGISIRELAERIAKCFPSCPGIEIRGVPVPGMPPARYVPDVSGTVQSLGVQVTWDLDSALRKTAELLRSGTRF